MQLNVQVLFGSQPLDAGMLKAACAFGVANWKAFSPSADMNVKLDLSPGEVRSITQEDTHIQPHEHDEELSELRTGLNAIDNTQHYEEVLLFNRFRREDPSISLAEQVHRFKKAVSQLPSRSIDLTADTEQGDFTELPRSLITNEHVDEDQSQDLQDTIGGVWWENYREDTREDQHQQERPESPKYFNLTGKSAVTKAKAHHDGARRCEILSMRAAGPSGPWGRTTDIKIEDRNASIPVQASIQEQVKEYDKSLKERSREGMTRAVKSQLVPLLGAQDQEDRLVQGSVSWSTTRVGEQKGSGYLKPRARQTVVQK